MVSDPEGQTPGNTGHVRHRVKSIVLDVREPHVAFGRAFESAAILARTPVHDLFDLLRQGQILARDAFCGMGHQSHLDPGVRRRDIRVVPRRFGEVPDGGWRLDAVTVQTYYLPQPPSNAIVYRVPAPDSPNQFGGRPHQSGLTIMVSLQPDGLYYVTDLRLYGST